MDHGARIGYSGLRNSLHQYTTKNWIGTQILFSGKNAAYFYKLIKTHEFDWSLLKFDEHTLSLGPIDLDKIRPRISNQQELVVLESVPFKNPSHKISMPAFLDNKAYECYFPEQVKFNSSKYIVTEI